MKKVMISKETKPTNPAISPTGDIDLINFPSEVLLKNGNSDTKFSDIFTYSPYGLIVLNMEGWIKKANLQASSLLDIAVDEFIMMDFRKLIKTDYRKKFIQSWRKLLKSGLPQSCELCFRKPDKSFLYTRADMSFAGDRNCDQVVVTLFDISKMKRAEFDLLQSKQDLDRAQEVASIGWWRLDIQFNILTWSDEIYRIFGVPKEVNISYESFLDIVHPEDRAYVDECWNKSLSGAPYDIEHRIVVGNKIKWIREKAYLEFDKFNKLLGGFGISQEITFRKEAEKAQKLIEEKLIHSRTELENQVLERTAELSETNKQLRDEIETRILKEKALENSQILLRAFIQQIDAISEEERTKISREIHDELGHQLTAIKYDIESLINGSEFSKEEIKRSLKSVLNMIESLIDSIRRIATELRPGILDQLGLIPAIEWQIVQFRRRTKIKCYYISTEIKRTFNKEKTTIIFRILQEILTNIIRHANATKVVVRLEEKKERFLLKVQDNGDGFEVENNLLRGSLGLIGMQERALSIGGEIKIKSSIGKGTKIIFRLKK